LLSAASTPPPAPLFRLPLIRQQRGQFPAFFRLSPPCIHLSIQPSPKILNLVGQLRPLAFPFFG
jgi:hypothetical protein